MAITYCPLTGSPLGYDRNSIGGDRLGVTGLLFMNNLVMYNRGTPESLFPQMLSEARCGAQVGRRIDRFPIYEMTWGGWKSLYPNTTVVSSDANISRDYTQYPYGDYESLSTNRFLYPDMPTLDPRRLPKERVLGLPSTDAGEPGIAFPFLALEAEPMIWASSPRIRSTWANRPETRRALMPSSTVCSAASYCPSRARVSPSR